MTGSTARNEGNLYPNDGYKLVTVACVVSILCIIVVAARFFASQLKKAKIGPDDWISIPALVGCHSAHSSVGRLTDIYRLPVLVTTPIASLVGLPKDLPFSTN